ncbi:MAG: CDP-alcohol phosphatidyltransferase family protein [Allosphingosinicella sp.]
MDDWLNRRIYHPLARLLARALVPTPVTPNMVSVAGGLLVALAGIFYTQLSWPASALLGFAAHALWHVVDGADGMLARLTGRASPIGELVDGVCDYASHMFLYTLLAVMLAETIGLWAYPLVLFAGLSRIAQANHAESQRRIYLWRVAGVPWLKQSLAGGSEAVPDQGLFARLFAPVGRLYVALAGTAGAVSAEIDAAVARLSGDPASEARARTLCREAGRDTVAIHRWMGANPRTVLLGLSMATGTSLWYFLLEVTFFNAFLIWSIARQRRSDLALAAELARR